MSWPSVPIESVSVPTYVRDPRRGPASSFRYIDISSIDSHTKCIATAPEIPSADAPSRARKAVLAGDILVSTVSPNLNTVALVPPALNDQIASTGFCVLRPNPKVILGKYLFYFSTTPEFVDALTSKVRGAHYPAVSDADVKNVPIPLPPLSEQRRFVEILDQTDALRKKRAEADAKAARVAEIQTLEEQQAENQHRLETLTSSLLHRVFSSDLTATWREAHKAELLAEMQQQAGNPLPYKSVFGTEFSAAIARFRDIPGQPPLPEADKNLVMHVELPILGGHVLMGTDAPESMGFTVTAGNNVYINLEPDTRAETDRLFKALSAGGTVEMALQEMFWGGYFGSLADRYGIRWMFNCASKA